MPSDAAIRDDFESHRAHLNGLAYRMLGSRSDAEDIVQEAWLRWERSEPSTVTHPRAYLRRIVTRLCLDSLKSARSRRERYVGSWLPEPVLGEPAPSAEAETELAQDVSNALLLALERLSPLERAAFLLHDVFDADYEDVAATLGRSEEACRQLASRARKTVRSARPRFAAQAHEHDRLVFAFGVAVAQRDPAALAKLLADDIVVYTDGGGKVKAALRPVRGPDAVTRFIMGVLKRFPPAADTEYRMEAVNGALGVVVRLHSQVIQTMAFDVRDGRVATVYTVRNPDKLVGLDH